MSFVKPDCLIKDDDAAKHAQIMGNGLIVPSHEFEHTYVYQQ
jgi:hypothetical protein